MLPPAGIPPHWRPIHGDYMPWNLREDPLPVLWLLDWEHARWGPPMADLVRYIVAHHSLAWSSADRIATIVRRTVGAESAETVLEVAEFWLSHENLQPSEHQGTLTRRKAKDSACGTGGGRVPCAGILNSNEGGSRARPNLLEIQSYCAKLPTVTDVRSSAR